MQGVGVNHRNQIFCPKPYAVACTWLCVLLASRFGMVFGPLRIFGNRFVSRAADAAAISEADEQCTTTRTITHPLGNIVRVEIPGNRGELELELGLQEQ